MPRGVMAAAVAVVVVASYLPLAAVVAQAVAADGAGVLTEAASALADARRRGLLVRSLTIAGGTAVAALALGVPVALWLRRAGPRTRLALSWSLLLPLVIPGYVFALGWQHAWDPGGALAGFVAALGLPVERLPGLASPGGVVAVLALRYLPLAVLAVTAGLARIDPALEEAASLTHGAAWTLGRVVLPLAWPETVAAGLVVFNLALVNYTVPSLLRVHTFPVEVFAAFSGLLDVAAAVSLSLPLVAAGVLSVVLARWAVGRRPREMAWSRPAPVAPSSPSRRLAGAALFAPVALAVLVPLFGVAGMTGDSGRIIEAYRLAAPQVWRTIGWSAAAATLLAAHGLAAGHFVARSRSLAAELVFLLPLALPPTVLGIGLVAVWNRPALGWMLETTAVLLLAYAGQLVPFATVPAGAALAGVPSALEEAAMLCGMGWWRRVRRVLLPLAWRGVAVGWVLTFALAVDEVGASILVQPPDGETLAVRIYNLSHYGAVEVVGGLCLLVVGIVAVPLLVLGVVVLRRGAPAAAR